MNFGRWIPRLGRRWLELWIPYISLAGGIYLAAAVLGAAAGTHSAPMTGAEIGADSITPPSPWFFFAYNGVTLLATALGFLFGGVPTVALLGYNGFLLGSAFIKTVGIVGLATTTALVVPHAVFELPAFWLAGAVGFRSIHLIWRIAEGQRNRTSMPVYLRQTVFAFIFIGILLGVAAVVESRFTIPIAQLLTEY